MEVGGAEVGVGDGSDAIASEAMACPPSTRRKAITFRISSSDRAGLSQTIPLLRKSSKSGLEQFPLHHHRISPTPTRLLELDCHNENAELDIPGVSPSVTSSP